MRTIKLYVLTAVVFFAVDTVWLTQVSAGFYRDQLGPLLRPDPVLPAAILFYLIYIGGIVVFAVRPGLAAASLRRAVLLGGFLGLVAYATFDLTSFALFADFPAVVVAVDLAWGTILSGGVAGAGYSIGRWLGVG